MSSLHAVGGRPEVEIRQKQKPGNPDYTPDPGIQPVKKIKKESDVTIATRNLQRGVIKLGIRIKLGQRIDRLDIRYGPGANDVMTLTPTPPGDTTADELERVLGRTADEQWMTYTAPFFPASMKKFETTLVLKPFDVHEHGFQVVTTAITYDGMHFDRDHYIYGVSVLPGKHSKALAFSVSARPPKRKPKVRAQKKAKKAKASKRRRR